MTQRWVSGPLNSLASREQVPLTEWRPLFTRLGVGRGTFFPAESAAPQRGRWPRPYAGWPPFIESFLLRQIPSCFPAGPWIYTGLSCLSTGVIIYPSPLSCKCSLLPVKGSRTSPQMLSLISESPSGKREVFQDNATRKKGKFITDSSQGFLPQPSQWCRVRKPWAEAVTQIYKVCISG